MVSRYYNGFSNHKMEEPINKLVYEITSLIKFKQDYNSAIDMILKNNLKLEDIVSRTARLTFDEVVKLADLLISRK